jgi:hypothetical protein
VYYRLSYPPNNNNNNNNNNSNLVNMDAFSLSDPLVVLYQKKGESWEEVGRTEMIKGNKNNKQTNKTTNKQTNKLTTMQTI